jgi:hypothetical protein
MTLDAGWLPQLKKDGRGSTEFPAADGRATILNSEPGIDRDCPHDSERTRRCSRYPRATGSFSLFGDNRLGRNKRRVIAVCFGSKRPMVALTGFGRSLLVCSVGSGSGIVHWPNGSDVASGDRHRHVRSYGTDIRMAGRGRSTNQSAARSFRRPATARGQGKAPQRYLSQQAMRPLTACCGLQ